MQEGILSLMQMPRTTIAVQRLREARLPYIVVLTDPTTGGVTASYAMLGDIHIAEPGALICFAGPRVIQQTIREQLPEGFQQAEYLLAHGMIDMVVHRHKLRETLARAVPAADRQRRAMARDRSKTDRGQRTTRLSQRQRGRRQDRSRRCARARSATSIEPEPRDERERFETRARPTPRSRQAHGPAQPSDCSGRVRSARHAAAECGHLASAVARGVMTALSGELREAPCARATSSWPS